MEHTPQPRLFIVRFVMLLVGLFAVTFPTTPQAIPDPGSFLAPVFSGIEKWFAGQVLGSEAPSLGLLVSDSAGLYFHLLFLVILSLAGSLVWMNLAKGRKPSPQLKYWFFTGVRYYLALQLLVYGFNKIFKYQFYFPEPNTLFTPVGGLPHDFLFWTSMGTSWGYSFFSGVAEVIPACMLLFRRTTLAGAALSFAVLTHVFVLNLAFDISVKLFSFFLLNLSLLLLWPNLGRMIRFFLGMKTEPLVIRHPELRTQKQILAYSIGKPLVVGLLLFQSLFIYFRAGVFNGDNYPKSPYWGAWEVETFVVGGDTLAPLTTDPFRFRRVFFHRDSYFIVQKMNDGMVSVSPETHPQTAPISFTYQGGTFQLSPVLSAKGEMLILEGTWDQRKVRVEARRIKLEQLPLMQPGFHLTVDEFVK